MEELRSLVVRARAGDVDAYGQIVRRFQDMAYGYAYSILGDFHLTEDAAQEAFIQAYRDLGMLDDPVAFPGWFRRIVFKYCDRLRRKKRVATVPLDSAGILASERPPPAEKAEKREMADRVLEAIRSLPENERTITTLFYIDGYSQKDIAEFLEVPVTTVNNRLHAARKRLKERMIAMVGETLKENAPDERFSQEVIDELLGRPRPLQIEGHPVKQVWGAIRAALPDWEVIEGTEVVRKADVPEVSARWDQVYEPGEGEALRPEMSAVTFRAMKGRTPPVRLLAAGRVFRPDDEDASHSRVFHQVDGLCIDAAADSRALESTLTRVLRAVFGECEVRCIEHDDYGGVVARGMVVEMNDKSRWIELAGCGTLRTNTLRDGGFDPDEVSGFAFGVGLERLAMLKYGIDDIRKLWQPPYVPE